MERSDTRTPTPEPWDYEPWAQPQSSPVSSQTPSLTPLLPSYFSDSTYFLQSSWSASLPPISSDHSGDPMPTFQQLLGVETDANALDVLGRNALYYAFESLVMLQDPQPILELLDSGSLTDWTIRSTNPSVNRPLLIHAYLHYANLPPGTLTQLISRTDAPVNDKDSNGDTLLLHLIRSQHPDTATLLNHPHISLEAAGENGHSPLNTAILSHNRQAAELLLSRGASLHTYNAITGEYPIHVAAETGLAWYQLLCDSNAPVDPNLTTFGGETALLTAFNNNHTDLVLHLLQNPNVDLTVKDNQDDDAFEIIAKETIRNHYNNYDLPLDTLVAYLNHPGAVIFYAEQGVERLSALDGLIQADQWLDELFPRLNEGALRKIVQPLETLDDAGLQVAYACRPQVLSAGLLIDSPDFRERLLNNLSCLMVPQDQEASMFPPDLQQHKRWIARTLYKICPQGKAFHTWLYERNIDFTTISTLVKALSARERDQVHAFVREEARELLVSSASLAERFAPLHSLKIKRDAILERKAELERQLHRLEGHLGMLNEELEGLGSRMPPGFLIPTRGRGGRRRGSRGLPPGLAGEIRAKESLCTQTENELKRARLLFTKTECEEQQALVAFEAIARPMREEIGSQRAAMQTPTLLALSVAKKIEPLMPGPEITQRIGLLATALDFWNTVPSTTVTSHMDFDDTATLMMLLVPPEHTSDAAQWLEEQLGTGLSKLYDVGLECEQDFTNQGISFTEIKGLDSTAPERREKCQALLSRIKVCLERLLAAPNSSSGSSSGIYSAE